MSSVDEAVKAAIKGELQEITDKLSQQEERINELKQAYEELSGRVEERGRDSQQLKEDVDRHKSEMEALDSRVKTELEAACKEIKDRLDRHESDEEGVGGLAQLRAKVDSSLEELTRHSAKMEEHGRTTGACKTRTDSMDETVRELVRKCEDYASSVEKSKVRLQDLEELGTQVRDRQQVVEDSVARKYDSLWKDVLHAMEDLKASMEQTLREDMKNRSTDTRRESQSQIKQVMSLVATVHQERRKLAASKDLLTAWQQHTWTSARRRTGLQWLSNALAGVSKRRQHQSLHRWVRHTSIEVLADQLREDYAALIPDVQKAIQDSKLPARCDALEQGMDSVRQEASSTKSSLSEHQNQIDKNTAALKAAEAGIAENGKTIAEVRADLSDFETSSTGHIDEMGTQLEDHGQNIDDIKEAQKSFALTKDVQTVMRDTLLIWNSVKHLDTAKADKKDMDSFAVETSNRDKHASRRLDDMQSAVSEQVREETLRLHEKWAQLDVKVDEGSKQFQHWEQMWEKLVGYVEELVKHIGDSQNTMRTAKGSRPPSNRPRLPRQTSERTLQEGEEEGSGPGLVWVNSAEFLRTSDVDIPSFRQVRLLRQAADRARPESAGPARSPKLS